MFRIIDARAEAGSFDWHYHAEYEFVLIESGNGSRYVGDSIEEFEVGEVVWIGAGLPHAWAPSPGGGPCNGSVVHLARERLPELPELENVHELLDRMDRGLVIAPDSASSVISAMRTLWAASGLQRVIGVLGLLDAASSVHAVARPLASSTYAAARRARRSTTEEIRMNSVFEYVRRHLDNDVSQTAVAEEVGLTSSSFSRFFKRETGQTFTAFVQEMRVSEACALLTETELGIAIIAYRVGFRSLAHFNKVFLRLKARTPREWRDAHAGRQSAAKQPIAH